MSNNMQIIFRLMSTKLPKQEQPHPFNGLFSRTTWVSQYQESGTILDFNKASDDGVAIATVGPHADHVHLTPDR